MNDIRCWRCDRKLAEIADGSVVKINLVCTRCGAKNPVVVPKPLDTAPVSAR